MWGDKRVSVVLMTYAERDSIRSVIEGFSTTGVVDEVLVVNNNAEPGTSEEVAQTPAREVFEPQQGYGNASRRGLREASGDLIVLAEPDGTFLPDRHQQAARLQRRVRRRLRHPHDARADLARRQHGVVPALGELGGRQGRRGALQHQPPQRRRLHLPAVHDASSAELVAERMRIGGNHAGPEMMLIAITSGARFVEIPVNYLPRVGTSSATGSRWRRS